MMKYLAQHKKCNASPLTFCSLTTGKAQNVGIQKTSIFDFSSVLRMKYLKLGLLLYTATLLTACGFHLRGMADIPGWLNQVYIVIQAAHRDLAVMLKDQMQTYNIKLVTSPIDAHYLLIIEQDSMQQQITSVSASTTPRQYQLFYTVNFKLIKPNGEVIVPDSKVVVTRQLTVNNNRILGSDAEELTMQKEMRREAVIQILNRLNRKP